VESGFAISTLFFHKHKSTYQSQHSSKKSITQKSEIALCCVALLLLWQHMALVDWFWGALEFIGLASKKTKIVLLGIDNAGKTTFVSYQTL
jgi:ADP-ribosylation factor family